MGFAEKTRGMTFKNKVKYFWDYYKWPTLITVFVVALIAMTLTQCITQVRPDVTILYVAQMDAEHPDTYVTDEHAQYMSEVLGPSMPDMNGDGKNTALVMSLMFEPEGQETQMTMALQAKLMAELAVGDAFILITDDKWYDSFVENGTLAPMTDVQGTSAADGFSVPLGGTFLQTVDSFEVLSDDLHICTILRKPSLSDRDYEKKIQDFERKADVLRMLTAKP